MAKVQRLQYGVDRIEDGGWVGIVLELVGAAIPAMVFFRTAALGVATWLFGVAPEPGN